MIRFFIYVLLGLILIGIVLLMFGGDDNYYDY